MVWTIFFIQKKPMYYSFALKTYYINNYVDCLILLLNRALFMSGTYSFDETIDFTNKYQIKAYVYAYFITVSSSGWVRY